mmetsp:Transcript_2564/g.3724  ORF Transcript_2564/g.3724 Transcript_2564/m.3724 type:complete len:97 (-) Transcript_2564:440-730(-)
MAARSSVVEVANAIEAKERLDNNPPGTIIHFFAPDVRSASQEPSGIPIPWDSERAVKNKPISFGPAPATLAAWRVTAVVKHEKRIGSSHAKAIRAC